MKQKKTIQPQNSTQRQEDLSKNVDPDRNRSEKGVVEYGNATKLTKGRGGRQSEAGYTRP